MYKIIFGWIKGQLFREYHAVCNKKKLPKWKRSIPFGARNGVQFSVAIIGKL